MTQAEDRAIPWPGPRPYDEPEWPIFFGRNLEIEEVNRRITAHRLSLLSGISGAGKTSLLRAGVVPLLRLRRYDIDVRKERSGKEHLVLLLRDWGTATGTNVSQMILSQIKNAIKALDIWGGEGSEAAQDKEIVLRALSSSDPTVIKAVRGICHGTGGLILVFDQLEEILRAGEHTAGRVTEVIRELFESGLPLKILLSLRLEHIADLRELESLVGGLVARTFFLEPITFQTIQEVVHTVCKSVGARFSGNAVKEVLKWLIYKEEAAKSGYERNAESLSDSRNVFLQPASETWRGSYLLSLQAILYEIFSDGNLVGTPIRIDSRVLKTYISRYGPNPSLIAELALQRWVTRALEVRAGKALGVELEEPQGATNLEEFEVPEAVAGGGSEPEKTHKVMELGEPELTWLVRRIAVRIAPHLSSGDFKVAQEQSDLFRKALGDDVWGLGLRHPELRRAIKIMGGSVGLNMDVLRLSEVFDDRSVAYLSGAALVHKWNPAEAAGVLLDAYNEALGRLQKGNILKPIFSPSSTGSGWARSWELVHDRLGGAFSDWAEEQRNTWIDCSASLAPCRGVSPIMITKVQSVDGGRAVIREVLPHLRWEGCVIAPVEGKAIFESAEFWNCHLSGSIFENCIFQGGGFFGCDLDGVLFRDCEFGPALDGSPFTIADCDAASLGILSSKIHGMIFHGCGLTQLTMKECKIDGPVLFKKSRLFLGNFYEVTAPGKEKWLTFSADCQVLFSSGDACSWNYLYFEEGCERVASEPLRQD